MVFFLEKDEGMSKFVEIKDKKQLGEFMARIWNFHDAVISKITYISGSYGSQEGTYPFDDRRELNVRFESVHYDEEVIDAVELKFVNLEKIFISPNNENYTTEIMCSKIDLKDDTFIFVNDDSFSIDTIITNEKFYYYIASKQLYYRAIRNYPKSQVKKLI